MPNCIAKMFQVLLIVTNAPVSSSGKWTKTSPYWNNHILDGTGLDDGTLSQWLQALGFPREMLNDAGPGNRWDVVINSDFVQKFFMGYADTSGGNNGHGRDHDGNTFRSPPGMNFAGYIHTLEKSCTATAVVLIVL